MDERPGSFHLARLKVIAKGPEVGVSEKAAVGVVRLRRAARQTALVMADLWAVRALLAVGKDGGRRGRRRRGPGLRLEHRPLFGAVLLVH